MHIMANQSPVDSGGGLAQYVSLLDASFIDYYYTYDIPRVSNWEILLGRARLARCIVSAAFPTLTSY